MTSNIEEERALRHELHLAWNANPFSQTRVAELMAKLMELCDYNLDRFIFGGTKIPFIVKSEPRNDFSHNQHQRSN